MARAAGWRSDFLELLLLGALWGASFLMMRLGARDFGPFPLVFVRVALAGLFLLPLAALAGTLPSLRRHWRSVALVGVVNSALPFVLFTVAAYVLSAGLMSVFNATAPLWAALVAWRWLGERPGRAQAAGLLLGLAGAVGLAWNHLEVRVAVDGVSTLAALAACVAAPICYGVGSNLARRRLAGVPPLALAAGSQLGAAAVLALPAALTWPAQPLSAAAWSSAVVLALGCTGLAYILYFRLIAHRGATHAMTVTFLIPAFAMGWGWLFLDERPRADMLAGCALILVGTALTTGAWRRSARPGPAPGDGDRGRRTAHAPDTE